MMRNIYGEVILKKDSILYHTSEEIFLYKNYNEIPMLFCTFHPSESDGINEYVTFIKLKKDVSLLFMIDNFRKKYIYSSLDFFIDNKIQNLDKKINNNLDCYVKELEKENFEGWFSSIENKDTVEIAIINDINLFDPIKTEELKRNWQNSNNLNNKITLKNWGTRYIICSINNPIIFKLNSRFKNLIEDYVKYGVNSKFPFDNVLSIILDNAKIYYHTCDSDYKIKWAY
jgi:hypothetical protein